AIERGQNHGNAIHLLAALITQEDSVVVSILEKINVHAQERTHSLHEEFEEMEGEVKTEDTLSSTVQMYLTPDLAHIIERSMKIAKEMNDEVISTEHLFLALFEVENSAQSFLEDAAVAKNDVKKAITTLRKEESKKETPFMRQ